MSHENYLNYPPTGRKGIYLITREEMDIRGCWNDREGSHEDKRGSCDRCERWFEDRDERRNLQRAQAAAEQQRKFDEFDEQDRQVEEELYEFDEQDRQLEEELYEDLLVREQVEGGQRQTQQQLAYNERPRQENQRQGRLQGQQYEYDQHQREDQRQRQHYERDQSEREAEDWSYFEQGGRR